MKFEETSKGWPGSGFNQAHHTIEIRKVMPSPDQPEVHISVTLTEWRGQSDRRYTMCGSLTLNKQDLASLLRELNI